MRFLKGEGLTVSLCSLGKQEDQEFPHKPHSRVGKKNTAYKFNLYEITKKIINVFISVNHVCNECKNIWPSTSIHIHKIHNCLLID